MRLLLDENISPALVRLLAIADIDVFNIFINK
jgi:predicted nuclease of predicted toxin-antitoxin system